MVATCLSSSGLLSYKACFHVCLYKDMFERFLLSLKPNLQLCSQCLKYIFFSTDNHSRVYLKPAAIQGSDYINASFINVRPCYSHWLSRGVGRCFVMGGGGGGGPEPPFLHLCYQWPWPHRVHIWSKLQERVIMCATKLIWIMLSALIDVASANKS